MKLNIGCGKDIQSGYDNIDAFVSDSRVKNINLKDLSKHYAPGSIERIRAISVLEHISHREIDDVMKMLADLLCTGGQLELKVPDLNKQIEYLQLGVWDTNTFIFMMYGGQDHAGNYHYMAFTVKSMTEKLNKVGLTVKVVEYDHPARQDWNANFKMIAEKI